MSDLIDRRSELCKTCIHTKVCMKDKNLVGDVPVMGHPMFFDNDKLYEEYKERERQGFPCEDYMSTAEPKIIHCKDCKWWDSVTGKTGYCHAAKHGYYSTHWEIHICRTYDGEFYCADAERRTDE